MPLVSLMLPGNFTCISPASSAPSPPPLPHCPRPLSADDLTFYFTENMKDFKQELFWLLPASILFVCPLPWPSVTIGEEFLHLPTGNASLCAPAPPTPGSSSISHHFILLYLQSHDQILPISIWTHSSPSLHPKKKKITLWDHPLLHLATALSPYLQLNFSKELSTLSLLWFTHLRDKGM